MVYSNLEKLLLKAASGHDFDAEFDTVIEVYGNDFDASLLRTQLQILKTQLGSETQISLSSVKELITILGDARSLFIRGCKAS